MDEQQNWREMPAGPELDEIICRMRGWTVSGDSIGNSATLWDPDGKLVNTWGSSNAWPNVVKIAWYNAPRFTRNMDDAITLIDHRCDYRLSRVNGSYNASIYTPDGRGYVNYADSPALAICRAWLAWHEAQS